jgi:outer membrane protein TolC
MCAGGACFIATGVAMRALIDELRRRKRSVPARHGAGGGRGARLRIACLRAGAAAAPMRLTLQQAVKLGLQQAPEVAIANLALAERQQNQVAARGALLPQVSFRAAEK